MLLALAAAVRWAGDAVLVSAVAPRRSGWRCSCWMCAVACRRLIRMSNDTAALAMLLAAASMLDLHSPRSCSRSGDATGVAPSVWIVSMMSVVCCCRVSSLAAMLRRRSLHCAGVCVAGPPSALTRLPAARCVWSQCDRLSSARSATAVAGPWVRAMRCGTSAWLLRLWSSVSCRRGWTKAVSSGMFRCSSSSSMGGSCLARLACSAVLASGVMSMVHQ